MNQIVQYDFKLTGAANANKQVAAIGESLAGIIKTMDGILKSFENTFGKDGLKDVTKLISTLKKLEQQQQRINKTAQTSERTKEQKKQIDSLEDMLATLKELEEQEGSRQKQITQLNKILKSGVTEGTELYEELTAQLGKLRAENKKVTDDIKRQQREFDAVDETRGRYERLNDQLVLLRKSYKGLTEAQIEAGEGTELLDNIQELDAELKEVDALMGNFQRNVGNYTSAFDALPGILGDVSGGVGKLKSSFDLLLANPVVAVFALIAAALVAIFRAFAQSSEGAAEFEKIGAKLNAVLGVFNSLLVDAAKAIISAFKDPIGSIQNFASNFFKAVTDPIGAVKDLIQATKELGEEIETQAALAAQLAELERNTSKLRAQTTQETAKLAREEQKLAAIADDNTRSFAERERAAAQQLVVQQKQLELQRDLAAEELSIASRRFAAAAAAQKDTLDLEQELADARANLVTAQAELEVAGLESVRRQRELVQDRLERDLDILIDGFNNVLQLNAALLQNEKLTLQERNNILQETERLANGSFDSQIETIQQFTKVRIDAAALLEASDARELNARIRSLGVSEIIEGRILEAVRDRRDALAQLQEAQQALDAEAAATAQKVLEQDFTERTNQQRALLQNGLITQEQFAVKQNMLQQEQLQKELQNAELAAAERRDKEIELQALRLEQNRLFFEQRVQQDRQETDTRLAELENRTAVTLNALAIQLQNEEITIQQYNNNVNGIEQGAAEARLEIEKDFLVRKAELAGELGIQVVGIAQQIANAEVQITKEKNERILASEQTLSSQRNAINAAQLDSLGSFLQAGQAILEADEANREKYGGILKAIAAGEIAINLIRELSQINANPVVNADVSQTTRTLLTAAAIGRAVAAGIKLASTPLEQGGAIPIAMTSSSDGVVQGPSHAEGGIDVPGTRYNIEGGEYWANLGDEIAIINKRSTAKHLKQLAAISRSNMTKGAKKRAFSAINVRGGGRRFALGGSFTNPDPLPAPRVVLDQPVGEQIGSVVASTVESVQTGNEASISLLRSIMEGLTGDFVYTDPAEVYRRGKKQTGRKARGL